MQFRGCREDGDVCTTAAVNDKTEHVKRFIKNKNAIYYDEGG